MNFNKVFIGGRLTRDVELSYTPGQCAIAKWGMVVNRTWVDSGGNKKEEAMFCDMVMFGKRAEVVSKYCKKGKPLFVEGRLTFDSWQAQDGSKRSKLRVTVENFEFLGDGTVQKKEQEQEQKLEPEIDTPF